VLKADASKSTAQTEAQIQDQLIKSAPLYTALENFVRNAYDLTTLAHDMVESFGEADPEELAKVARRASAGYEEGFIATALAIKANEAILKGERIQITPELYELG
jgi:hypothetical protein